MVRGGERRGTATTEPGGGWGVAGRIAEQPRLALQLAKQACNHMEVLAGKDAGIDASFGYHHFAHANNQLVKGDYIAGFDGKKMAAKNKAQEAKKG